MKKIEKVEEIKSVSYVYIATDGTEFSTEDECKKYEESAKCVLLTRYKGLVVKGSSEFGLFGFGCEENTIEVCKPNTVEDVFLILQLIALFNPQFTTERLDEQGKRIMTAIKEKDFVFIYRGFGDYEDFCFEGTRNEHINVLNRACQPEEKKEEE